MTKNKTKIFFLFYIPFYFLLFFMFVNNSVAEIIPTYPCGGSIPSNATACSYSSSGVAVEEGVSWHNVSNCCTIDPISCHKCEYKCNSNYNYVDGECLPNVAAECGGYARVFSSTVSNWSYIRDMYFCSSGTPSPVSSSISFPGIGSTTTWR